MSHFYELKRMTRQEVVSKLRSGEKASKLAEDYGLSQSRIYTMLLQTEREERAAAEMGPFYGLSTRARASLENENCQTASDVAAMTKKQIKEIPNIGKLTVDEIEGWLRERGLEFATEQVMYSEPKTIPIAIRFLERHGYTVIPPKNHT